MKAGAKNDRQRVAVLSPGMRRWFPEIEAVTGRTPLFRPLPFPRDYGAVCGWGQKSTSLVARARARRMGISYLAIEDGFFRSVEPGSPSTFSMICDDEGIYYNAATPSRLERLIAERASNEPETIALGRRIIDTVVALRLSKYNNSRKGAALPTLANGLPCVLVVDQTFGDQSVAGAAATADDFANMLKAAIAENPGCNILLKTHPETVAGLKRGYFEVSALPTGVMLLIDNIAPADLLSRVTRVYCVSSQLGFEALYHGVPVTCFGLPFYAGWGLTDDRKSAPARRTARPRLESLVAAAIHDYPTYFDVYDRTPCDIWQALAQLAFLRDEYQKNARMYCVGVAGWKRKTVRQFLHGPDGAPQFVATLSQAADLVLRTKAEVGVWSSKPSLRLASEKDVNGAPLVRIEDGFLRSVGLGAAFTQPLSLVFDRTGIYYDPTGPSDLETLCETAPFPDALMARAKALREAILQQRISKYNVQAAASGIPGATGAILVVGQVEDDASVALASTSVSTNLGLLQAARRNFPDDVLVYRPHPDVSSALRKGKVTEAEALQFANAIDADTPIVDLLDKCSRVVTLSSLTGFEALLRNVPVTTFGRPFYAGWGLTDDHADFSRRTRKLTRDELIAATLILYPRYVDPVSALPCTVERAVARLVAAKSKPATRGQHVGMVAGRLLHHFRSRT